MAAEITLNNARNINISQIRNFYPIIDFENILAKFLENKSPQGQNIFKWFLLYATEFGVTL